MTPIPAWRCAATTSPPSASTGRTRPTNIAEIARELNIGLDSLVFLDDNPAERGLVRQQLPDVLTVEMPRDPALLHRGPLLGLDVFETLALTDEDQRRGAALSGAAGAQGSLRRRMTATGDLSAYLRGPGR